MLFDGREFLPANDPAFRRDMPRARVRKIAGARLWLCLHRHAAGTGDTPLAAIVACRKALGIA